MYPLSTSDPFNPAQLDDLDRQVIHALQIWPRAPWTLIGDVLGVDPMTASRRWQALEESGVAWISVADVTGVSSLRAVIDLRVKSSRVRKVIQALESDPRVFTLRSVLGDWTLTMDWQGQDLAELDSYLSDFLADQPGIRTTRTHVVTGVLLDGSGWRLRELSPDQVSVLRTAAQFEASGSTASEIHDIDHEILRHVSTDGRTTLTSLAKKTGTTIATVRRHLDHMLSSRAMVLRCDIARPLSGWPIAAHFMCSVEPQRINEVTEALSRAREIRAVQSMVGPYNLCLNFWVKNLQEITRVEAHLARNIPQIRIGERSITSRMVKHMQVSLDEYGRRRQ
jgi:DNA-binding Lrp family transcriptional regulator